MCTMIATAVSTGLGLVGQYFQQRTQEKAATAAAEYNAQVAENQAATQKQLAQNEIAKGVADRERQQRAAARAMGEMRAGMGASGFQMDTGTMVSLLDESAMEHQYDSNIIRQNSEQVAWQHMVGATTADNNAAFADYQRQGASSGRAGSFLGMGGTLLGGLAAGIGQYNALPGGSGKQTSGWTYSNQPGSAFGGNDWWNKKSVTFGV